MFKENTSYIPRKVAHIITRMIIGGAQENTYYSVRDLDNTANYQGVLITGPEKGPEGRLKINDLKRVIETKNMVRRVSLFKDIKSFFELVKILKNEQFHIVHTHSAKAGILGRWAAYYANVPVIIHTIHGLPFHPYQNHLINFIYITLEKITSLITTKVITVAPEMKRKLIKNKITSEDKITSIYSGMDLEKFKNSYKYRKDMRSRFHIKEEDVIIGTVARLFPLKGHEFILAAAKEIVRKNKNVKFLWVGGGILKESFLESIDKMNMHDNFILTDLIEPEEIPKYFSMIDIMVHPSLREGLARVIPQAFAAKIPVISFDIDGARDIIKNNENGFLIEAENIKDLTEAIISLVENNEICQRFKEKACKEVEPFFDYKYMTREIRALYEELI